MFRLYRRLSTFRRAHNEMNFKFIEQFCAANLRKVTMIMIDKSIMRINLCCFQITVNIVKILIFLIKQFNLFECFFKYFTKYFASVFYNFHHY